MTVGERIKSLRLKNGMSQVEFAEKIDVSKQTLYKYENNIITNIPSDKIEAAANVGGTSPAALMGWDELSKSAPRKGVVINVLGRVAAGIPIEAVTDIIDTEEIPEEMARTGEFFGLQIHGNSMEPKFSEGDVVIVRLQDDAESGDIVIAMINGDDATCKRLRKYRDGIELISTNPSYEPMFFSNEDIEKKPVKIIGRVVELRAKF
ncbi:LexA family protein [Parablautia sp. Marseille-Q6255]|uniref:LexA family protein n=1 Tax=Parablautia sp. Marseille-Q6255 TaxID=3039593 RepID=UPI0024BD1154|nr:XRE family transcriptional regulator [Parablautia sp. Marseille-Q6255]